jgi:integrase
MAVPRDLTTAEVAALSKDGTHRVGRSLYLQIRGGNKSWLPRYRFRGKPKWMSLGPAWVLTLTEAKRKVVAAQKLLLDGIDPLAARKVQRQATSMSFEEAAREWIASQENGWTKVHRGNVLQSLETHVFPIIGREFIDQISANHVVDVLDRIWLSKTETATRVRTRIEAVIDWATSAGHRSGANPARWKGSMKHRFPKPSTVRKVVHHVAVPIEQAPSVYAALEANERTTSKLLRFLALTAVRFSEAAKATWSEFDLDADVPTWLIPAERMKMRVTLRVPLSQPAVEILRSQRREGAKPGDLVFSSNVKNKPLSDTVLISAES